MNLWHRFKRLTFWNKLGVISAICSILAIPLCIAGWLLYRSLYTSVVFNVKDSSDSKVQTVVNSPNTTQLLVENLTVNLPTQLERKLTINAEYVNKLQGDKYITLLRGRLKAPYPVPNLRIEAHGETVEKIEFTGTGIYVISDRGKNEGYVFAIWQDAIGSLEFKIISRKPGKLHVHFVVQE